MQTLIHIIDRFEHTILVWTIVGLAGIGFVQIFGRYIFNYSFTWFEELGRYIGVFIAFLGAAIGVKKGSHFSMDLIVKMLNPLYRKYLQFFSNLLSGAFFFVITFYSTKMIIKIYGFGSTSPTLGIPMYIVYFPILLFSFVMGVRFFLCAIRYLKGHSLKEA